MMMKRALFAGLTVMTLSACSLWPQSAETDSLASVERASIDVEWQTRIGDGTGRHVSRLTMVADGDTVFALDPNGTVAALDLNSGSIQWQVSLEHTITAGLTVTDEHVFVATRAGELLALNRDGGDTHWTAPLTSEAVAPAGVDDTQVYVHTVDGRVTAYDLQNGKQKWSYEAALPVLTVRGTGSPRVLGQLVITGFANGKVIALDRRLGIPRWEKRLAIPEGRSELERLVDIDGTVLLDDQLLYAASYHGKLAAITPRGETRWEEDGSSYYSPVMGLGNLYLTLDGSRVRAFDVATGGSVWLQDALEGRKLGAPVAYDSFLAVTDLEGYVYLMNQVDGSLVGKRLLRPHGLHINTPNQSEATNWRRMRGKVFGSRNPLLATEAGILAYTNDGSVLLLSVSTD